MPKGRKKGDDTRAAVVEPKDENGEQETEVMSSQLFGANYRKRFYYSPALDIELLQEVISWNPWSTKSGWSNLAVYLRGTPAFNNIEAKSIRDRINLLLTYFRRDDMQNLRRSGTIEEYNTREQLLQEASDMEWAWGKGKGLKRPSDLEAANTRAKTMRLMVRPAPVSSVITDEPSRLTEETELKSGPSSSSSPADRDHHKSKKAAKADGKGGKKSEPQATPEKASDETKAPAKKGGWGWAHGRKKKADADAAGDEPKQNVKPAPEKASEEAKAPAKKGGWGWAHGRKRKADEDATGDEPKPKLKTKSSISDNFAETDFASTVKSASGKQSNIKIASWNVNGVRAWLEKDGLSYIKAEKPDVLCIQELKCDKSKIPAEAAAEGYTTYWLSGDTEGYSGVGMFYKTKPLKVTEGIGIAKHDDEGRVLTAEFEKFFLVNTYIPNSGRGLPRLKYRTQEWDVDFRKYLKSLDAKKPVVWCGDLNVAHEEIDIRNPKGNRKNAGFTDEERNSFSETLKEGFIDSFRYLYPDQENAYSFWTYMMNARAKNAGWRLDYFVLSERLKDKLCESAIRSKVMGSDHCPIVLHLAL